MPSGRAFLLNMIFDISIRPMRLVSWVSPNKRSRTVLILNALSVAGLAREDYFADNGIDAVFRDIGEIAIKVETGAVSIYETVRNQDIADFGIVQAVSYPPPTATLLNTIAAYLDHYRVQAINLAGIGAPTKLLHYVQIAQAGLRVPKARYLPVPLMRDTYPALADQLGVPFVLKQLRGGKPDVLIASSSDLKGRLGDVNERRDAFLVQEFIPGNKKLRVFVFGGVAAVAILRDSLGGIAGNQFSDNVMIAEPGGIDPAARNLAIRAARVTGCDVASIDLVQHWATSQWYVLQVRPNPPISTGPYIEEKMQAYSGFLQRRTRSSGSILQRALNVRLRDYQQTGS